MPSPEEDGRDPVDRSCSPDEPAEMHTDRGSVGESGPTMSASSAPAPHHRVNIQSGSFTMIASDTQFHSKGGFSG